MAAGLRLALGQLRAAQAQLDSLLLELDAKETTLRSVRRQAEESESKRVTAQRLLVETQKREHQRRLEARNAVDGQRVAEARLRACELELGALKVCTSYFLPSSFLLLT